MALIRIPPLYDWAKAKARQMRTARVVRSFAKWHVWLAWLTGIPVLMWTVTGLVMVAQPIEEVRGEHLRIAAEDTALPADLAAAPPETLRGPAAKMTTQIDAGRVVTRVDYLDGSVERFAADGSALPPLDGDQVRQVVAERIVGGEQVTSATLFEADEVPIDFRREMPVWRVALADGTYIYVGRDTGQIEAVRTRWWRIFDTMWGLHIMDLETRGDTSHPVLIIFAALAVLGSLVGCIAMFRRRGAGPRHA